MSPKTTPNAERPSADRLAAFAGRARVSPAPLDKGPTPAIGAIATISRRSRSDLKHLSTAIVSRVAAVTHWSAHRRASRSRSALLRTETELRLIAAAATIGLRRSPNTG